MPAVWFPSDDPAVASGDEAGHQQKTCASPHESAGFAAQNRVRKWRTTNSERSFPGFANRLQDLEIVRPDQVRVSDITYIRLRTEFVYLAVIMDVLTRCIRGWHLSRSLDQELTLTALTRALAQRVPEIHHSDQGVQCAATGYVELLRSHGVQISMAEIGQAWQNGYAGRLMRTIKEEEVKAAQGQVAWSSP
jgi:putative transposase